MTIPAGSMPPFQSPSSTTGSRREFGFVSAIWRSFFSADLYRDVVRSWPGINALYLLVLLAVTWAPDGVRTHRNAAKSSQLDEEVLNQFPTITLREGELTLDPPGPHYIKDPEKDRLVLILDTEATTDTLDQFEGDLIIVNRSQFITRNARRGQVRVQELSQFPDFTLDEARLRRIAAWIKRWLGLTFYLGAVLISFIYRLVQAFFYGGVAFIMGRVFGATLGYGAGIRLATIAVTPSLLLGVGLEALGVTPRALFWWPTCMILTVGYIVLGVHAHAKAATDPF